MDVVRKDIKNVHLSVHPPTGRVRIAAPSAHEPRHHSRLRDLEIAAGSRNSSENFRSRNARLPANIWTGKATMFGGSAILLKVVEADQPPSVELSHSRFILRVRPGTERRKAASHPRSVVSRAITDSCSALDREMATADGRKGEAFLRPANEDEMGQLQSSRRHRSA